MSTSLSTSTSKSTSASTRYGNGNILAFLKLFLGINITFYYVLPGEGGGGAGRFFLKKLFRGKKMSETLCFVVPEIKTSKIESVAL